MNSSFEQTNHNCINNSSSKQLYSFSKQKRFCSNKQALTSQVNFLGCSYENNKPRPMSFSKSKKQLVFQNEQQYKSHPSPDIYNSHSLKSFNCGITIGIKLKPFYQLKNIIAPSPVSYSARSFDRHNKSVSFSKQRRQLKYPKQNWQCTDSPGPGPYLIETQKLKSILSNYKNIKNAKIINKSNNFEQSLARLNFMKQNTKNKQKLDKKKNQTISQTKISSLFEASLIYKKQKTTIFSKQMKKSIFDIKNKNPSPGSYQSFSQFALRNKPDVNSTIKINKSNSKQNVRAKTLPVVEASARRLKTLQENK